MDGGTCAAKHGVEDDDDPAEVDNVSLGMSCAASRGVRPESIIAGPNRLFGQKQSMKQSTIAKWSHLGPLAMSELELGSLVVQRCLCCLLGMCVFLVVRTLFATVGRLGARSVTCSSGLLAGGFAGLFSLIIKNKSIFPFLQ